MKKIIAVFLALVFVISAVSLPVFADDTIDITKYPTTEYKSQQEKVDTMTLMYESKEYGYELYFDVQSGEFALKNTKTGEYLFSNPYDIAINSESSSSESGDNDPIRQALLSQIILEYKDTLTGAISSMKSFTDAALAGGQIQFKVIDSGVRVEYALGTVETKRLIPQWIEKSRFETQILDILSQHTNEMTSEETQIYNGILYTSAFYKLVGPAPKGAVYDPQSRPSAESPETIKFLVDNEDAQMYFLMGIGERAKKNIEKLIRKYCPQYTYDKLEEDHEITGYEGNEKEPPLFRMAIEYKIDAHGLTASIPAKSIRYNETNYSLESIVLLPYIGCTTLKTSGAKSEAGGETTRNGGYIFIPDGSGTLLSYYNEDGTLKKGIQGGSMYGSDFAIENLPATDVNAETYRLPVFGLTETFEISKSVSRGNYKPALGNKIVTQSYARGYVAFIEEGDAFASIRANLRECGWIGASGDTEYSTVFPRFAIKQSDSVKIGSSIGGSDAPMSTTNKTKYVGNYTVRYIMLSDPKLAEENNVKYYEPSYIGMANAYRDYLIASGSIDKMNESDVKDSIPLYVHSFGALDVKGKFLGFPKVVEKPLTTFDDVITMAEDFKNENIKNVRFILEGFADGNMTKSYYPTYVKWNNKLGGKKDLNNLLSYVSQNEISIFPEFNFSSVAMVKNFSGFSFRKHVAKSMSGRYTTQREYDFIFQNMYKFGMYNVVSSGAYLDLFEKFAKDYDKYDINAISSLRLGEELSSNFDEDYPITRENSKLYTQELLGEMLKKYDKVLVSGGNSYTLPCVTDIVNLPLDNSNYQISSYSVPFMGIVLHGYMNYAGNIANREGDIRYEILKSIENGAALYFMLSYQNTNDIKGIWQMGMNENYSVSFQTWFDEVVDYYNELNAAIGDLQTATITGHDFVTAYRYEGKAHADFMFTQSAITLANHENMKKQYEDTMDEVDRLRMNNMVTDATRLISGNPSDPSDPINEICEITLRDKNLLLSERHDLEEVFSAKYQVDNVVKVTYTGDDGSKTEFFINYNSFDVAIEYNGGVFVLGAEDFVSANEIKTSAIDGITYESVTSLQATAGQLENYKKAYNNYVDAVTEGNAIHIERALNALHKTIKNMTKSTTHVVKLTNMDGDVAYFNYTNKIVLVPVSETEYFEIPSQSYVLK